LVIPLWIMASYDFRTLNDKDFEELCRDLLNEREKADGVQFQSFKRGKDGGIDLRFSTVNYKNEIIVQVKHYLESGKEKLIQDLKDELPKVLQLQPNRYIIATSVGLLPQDKDKIKELFHPYIQNSSDILCNEDINALLVQYHRIQEEHPKLWLTNALVIKRILLSGVIGRSQFKKEDIYRKLGLYVQTKTIANAFNKLRENKFLIITGLPGVGKTTLAEMIILNLFREEYELVAVQKELNEIESTWDAEKKQIFYFDDFLGANYLEILENRKDDSAIVGLIKRIKSTKNKFIILTTRISILNSALLYSEIFRNNGIELGKYQLELREYSQYDKAKILYNHLFFTGINEEFRTKIFENKNYWEIIKHPYYNPRVIEFFTNPAQLKLWNVIPENYFNFIKKHLDDPSIIWKHAYEQQLDDNDRFFLTTLFSFGESVNGSILRPAFEKRLEYECSKNGHQRRNNAFSSAEQKLADGFISIIYTIATKEHSYAFVNPSVRDFFIKLIASSYDERQRIIKSALYAEQLLTLFPPPTKSLVLTGNELKDTGNFIRNNIDAYHICFDLDKINIDQENLTLFKRCMLLMEFSNDEAGKKTAVSIAFQIKISSLVKYYDSIIDFLVWLGDIDEGRNWIDENWGDLISSLIYIIPDADPDVCRRIIGLFEHFEKDYDEFIADPDNRAILEEQLQYLFEEYEKSLFNEVKDQFLDMWNVERAYENVQEKVDEILTVLLSGYGFEYSCVYLSDNDYEELFKRNQQRNDEYDADSADYHDYDDYYSGSADIDNLFDMG
jgi:GTPase SAR1 family protein